MRSKWQRGSVVLRGEVWSGVYYDHTGKQTWVRMGTKKEIPNKREARERVYALIRRDEQSQPERPKSEWTLQEFWERIYLPLNEPIWEKAMSSSFRNVVTRHVLPTFGKRILGDITEGEMQIHLFKLGENYSPSLVKKVRSFWVGAFKRAVADRFVDRTPIVELKVKTNKEVNKRHLDRDEIPKLTSGLPFRDRVICHMFVVTGLRPGELFARKWNDLNGDTLFVRDAISPGGKMKSPKTKASRAPVVLSAALLEELKIWKEMHPDPRSDNWIFVTHLNQRIDSHNYLRRYLKPKAQKLGIKDLTFQVFRRTNATLLYGQTKDAKIVQTQLRHAKPDMSMNEYVQTVPDSVRRAVNLLDESLFGETRLAEIATVSEKLN